MDKLPLYPQINDQTIPNDKVHEIRRRLNFLSSTTLITPSEKTAIAKEVLKLLESFEHEELSS